MDERTYGTLLLVVAAVFVAAAVFGGMLVTPWLFLVALTAVPNILTAVKALRRTPADPAD